MRNTVTNYLHKLSKKIRIYKKKSEFKTLAWLKIVLSTPSLQRRDQNNKYLSTTTWAKLADYLKNSDAVCNNP